jgi:hypothetical protein
MHQPTDVRRELLRFGTRQQHAIVQRMQKSLFADPAVPLDEFAMHQCDLSGGSAEAQQADASPDR